jgi:hypothetical protein
VDGVVGLPANADEILWIKNPIAPMFDVLHSHRIHVMNQKASVNFVAGNSEVAPHVSNDDCTTNASPLRRGVEDLIHPSSVPEGEIANLSLEAQVVEAFVESFKPSKFGIASVTHLTLVSA